MTYRIDKIDTKSNLNLKGWRIIRDNGDVLMPFTTKAEAQRLLDFFGAETATCPCDQCRAIAERGNNDQDNL